MSEFRHPSSDPYVSHLTVGSICRLVMTRSVAILLLSSAGILAPRVSVPLESFRWSALRESPSLPIAVRVSALGRCCTMQLLARVRGSASCDHLL